MTGSIFTALLDIAGPEVLGLMPLTAEAVTFDEEDLATPCPECGCERGRLRENGSCDDPECCGTGRFDILCANCGTFLGTQ